MRRVALLVLLTVISFNAFAQEKEPVRLSGLAYVDYYYTIDTPEEEEENLNGFTYRRLYLTADYKLSDSFSGRARLESHDRSMNDRGTVPFIKDLYLTYKAPGGHSITGGIAPNPVYQVSEEFLGFRSLEQTVIEFFRGTSSRDFGLLFRGPVLANNTLRYAAMVANGESVRPEDDKYKRVYGQLEAFPTEATAMTLGADYEARPDGEGILTLNAFAGVDVGVFRAGVEGFLAQSDVGPDGPGISVFAVGQLTEKLALMGRADFVDEGVSPRSNLFLAGVAYQPVAGVRLMPNLHWVQYHGDGIDPEIRARMTLEAKF